MVAFLIMKGKFWFMDAKQKKHILRYNPAVFARAASIIVLFSLTVSPLIFWILYNAVFSDQEVIWPFLRNSAMMAGIVLAVFGIRKLMRILILMARGK